MRAVVRDRYGPPDLLRLVDVAKPAVGPDGVLVRVRAASLNRLDWYALTGTPYVARPAFGVLKPKSPLLGVDFAGIVEEVASAVGDFKAGDEVFGGRTGALAEYVCGRREAVALKPPSVTFEEAAAVPTAAITALQGLRDKAGLQPGQKVLVNGASGGVGTFAVQIAKWLGADVTAVCSTSKVDVARSLGADRVVDYTREDFTRDDSRYDVLFDVAGNRSWAECKRVLTRDATVVVAGGEKVNRVTGPLGPAVKMRVAATRATQKVVVFVASFNRPDLDVLRDLLAREELTPVIDRRYKLEEAAEALRYMGEKRARGKVVLTV